MKQICIIFLLFSSLAQAADTVKEIGYIFDNNGLVATAFLKINDSQFGPLCVEVTKSDGIDLTLDAVTGDLKKKTDVTNLLLSKAKTMITELQDKASALPAKQAQETTAASKIHVSITDTDLTNALKP